MYTLSIAETSRACLVSYNCVDKYVRLFQHRATLSPLVSDNVRPKKIPWWMEAYLEALVRIYPSLYLRELQYLLANDFNLAPGNVPSITAVTNLFTNLRTTPKKCVVIALERMSHHVLHYRRLFSSGEEPLTLAWYIFSTRHVLPARQLDELTCFRAQASDLKVEQDVASIQLSCLWIRGRSHSGHPSRRKPNSADNNRHY